MQNYCSSSLNVQIYDDVISNNPVVKAIQTFFRRHVVLHTPIKVLTSSLFIFKQATSIHNTTDLVEPQVALVKALLQMTFDITESLLIPFNVDQYANALHTWTEGLVAFYNGTLRKQNITLGTETLQKYITQKS